MRKILFGIFILFLASCGNEKSSNTTDSINSKFIWDFSKTKKLIYSFSQTTNNENKMTPDEPADKSHSTAVGNLKIRIKDNNLADLSLIDIEQNRISYDTDGNPQDTMNHKSPPTVIQDMKPDGSFSDSNIEIMFKMLFPLPSKDLSKGEKDKIEMNMPFNVNGSRLTAKGFNTLEFSGFKTIKERECAVLVGSIDISDMEIPEELNGEYKNSTKGKATYYFDLKDRIYVGSDIEMTFEAFIDTKSGGLRNEGMYWEVKSQNIFKIRLVKIE